MKNKYIFQIKKLGEWYHCTFLQISLMSTFIKDGWILKKKNFFFTIFSMCFLNIFVCIFIVLY